VPDARAQVLALLKRFGWNATSFQVLASDFRYWFHGQDALVAYVDTGRAWVAAGPPIAEEQELTAVAQAFTDQARRSGRRAAFFATESRFVEQGTFDSLLIGEQPSWDPSEWAQTVDATKSLREQLRRARAHDVVVTRLDHDELASAGSARRAELEALIARWIGAKAMPPMGFLVRVDPFAFPAERRLFVAYRGQKLVGFAGVVPVYARSGWFIENLVRAPDAPNGTTELLVDAAMRDAAAAGSHYVTLGLAPLAGPVPAGLRLAGKYGAPLYDFSGLHAFKAKFRPRDWAPIYLTYPREGTSHAALYDSLAAFAHGGLLRYGIEALLRGPPVVVRVLALLLVPWTVLLATAESPRWFPAPWVQWFWVAFDMAVGLALFSLGMRWRTWLASLLLGLVVCDAAVTLLEALVFNVPHVKHGGEVPVILAAILAPVLASVVLKNARRRALRTHYGA
jgi:phosphatidylglycerol lysyltransferase